MTRGRRVKYEKKEGEGMEYELREWRLFEAMRRDYEKQEFTVNSSPYAVEIYKRLGFVQEDAERLSPEGLRYTPMRFTESR